MYAEAEQYSTTCPGRSPDGSDEIDTYNSYAKRTSEHPRKTGQQVVDRVL